MRYYCNKLAHMSSYDRLLAFIKYHSFCTRYDLLSTKYAKDPDNRTYGYQSIRNSDSPEPDTQYSKT